MTEEEILEQGELIYDVPEDISGTYDLRGRFWVMTSYGSYDDVCATLRILVDQKKLRYAIVGREICPTTSRAHLQCYLHMVSTTRWSALSAKFPRAWIQLARGNVEQNQRYCRKQDTEATEFGKAPTPTGQSGGRANKQRWEDAKALALADRVEEIPGDIYIPYYNGLNAIARDHQIAPADLPPLREFQVGYWYYGPSGSGKTYAAIHEFPGAYRKIAANKWWDGYNGEENVIIDDLDQKHDYLGFYLKIWADRYAFQVEMKGKSRLVRPKKVIVTSNWHIKEIWQDSQTVEPLLRRFKVVRFSDFFTLFGDVTEEVREPYNPLMNNTE